MWGEKLVVEKGKSAFGNFARQFIIRGDDSLSPQEFFRKARGEIKLLLRQNPQTKVQCILHVEMIQNRISGEDETSDPFFPSRQKENLGNNYEVAEEMIREMIEAMENYNKRGSNWIFKKVIRLDVNFVRWKPLGGSAWIPLPAKLANKKAVINVKKTSFVSNGVSPELQTWLKITRKELLRNCENKRKNSIGQIANSP